MSEPRPLGSWRDEPRGPTSETMRARAVADAADVPGVEAWDEAREARETLLAVASWREAYDDGRAHAATHRDEGS